MNNVGYISKLEASIRLIKPKGLLAVKRQITLPQARNWQAIGVVMIAHIKKHLCKQACKDVD